MLKRFLRDESGLETVEWAFILGLVVLVAVLALVSVKPALTTIFTEMTNELDSAAAGLGGGS